MAADDTSSSTSGLTRKITVHSDILRKHSSHDILRSRCKSWMSHHSYWVATAAVPLDDKCNITFQNILTATAASKHDLDVAVIHCSDCRISVVSRQLLPNGLDGPTVRREVWRQQDKRLDERLSNIVDEVKLSNSHIMQAIYVNICALYLDKLLSSAATLLSRARLALSERLVLGSALLLARRRSHFRLRRRSFIKRSSGAVREEHRMMFPVPGATVPCSDRTVQFTSCISRLAMARTQQRGRRKVDSDGLALLALLEISKLDTHLPELHPSTSPLLSAHPASEHFGT